MKNFRKQCIIFIASLAACCFSAGAVALTAVAAESGTIVVCGASVRMAAPTGIRFKTTVSQRQDGYVYGTLIIPKTEVTGTIDVNTENVCNIEAKKWQSDTEYTAVLGGGAASDGGFTDYPMAAYNETLVARSYAVKDGVYTYFKQIERRLAGVASLALADMGGAAMLADSDETETPDGGNCEFLKGICDYVLGADGFAFKTAETYVSDTVDLKELFAEDNGAEGLHAIWISEDDGVATVSEDGVVTAEATGETTVIAIIGNNTAEITVKVGGAQSTGMLTGAEDGAARVTLYAADGAYMCEVDASVSDGKYYIAAETDPNAASAIVTQGTKAAFIDDWTTSKDGVMQNAKFMQGNALLNGETVYSTINSKTLSYAQRKGSVNGETTTVSAKNTAVFAGAATNGDYAYRFTVSAAAKLNGHVFSITDGAYEIYFERSASTKLKIGMRNVKTSEVVSVYIEEINNPAYCEKIVTDLCCYGYTITKVADFAYGVERIGNEIYVSLGRNDESLYRVFKITADGIQAADGKKVYGEKATVTVNEAHMSALNEALGGLHNVTDEALKEAFSTICASGREQTIATVCNYAEVTYWAGELTAN